MSNVTPNTRKQDPVLLDYIFTQKASAYKTSTNEQFVYLEIVRVLSPIILINNTEYLNKWSMVDIIVITYNKLIG
jgi:hypothetical protein